VSGGVDDGEAVLLCFKSPKGNIDGDSSLSFGLEFVHDPCVFEESSTCFRGFFLVLFDGLFIDASALVDEVASGGGLS
jgi:hypothetical protein